MQQTPPSPEPAQFSDEWKCRKLALGEPLVFFANQPDAERSIDVAAIQDAARSGSPVSIIFGIISKPLNLIDVKVEADFRLQDCRCSDLDLTRTEFRKEFSLSRSHVSGDVRALRATFARDLDLSTVSVAGFAEFKEAAVANEVTGVNAAFGGGLYFHGANVGGSIQLRDARLDQVAAFDGARIAGDINLRDASCGAISAARTKINGALWLPTEVNGGFTCTASEIGTGIWCSGTAFKGDYTNFAYAVVAGGLYCDGATFSSDVSFHAASISGAARFDGAYFAKDADFDSVRVSGRCSFDASPGSKSGAANFAGDARFHNASFEDSLDISDVCFEGNFYLSAATIGGNLNALRTTFRKTAAFFEMTIGKNAVLSGTTFSGDAYFDRSTIKGDLILRDVRDDGGVVRHAYFLKPVSFFDANVGGSVFEGVHFEATAFFGRFSVGKEASFRGARFAGDALFTRANLGTLAGFEECEINGTLGLRSAQTTTLNFAPPRDATQPARNVDGRRAPRGDAPLGIAKVDMRRCKYDEISAPIVQLIDAFRPFDPFPYIQLEKVLRRSGSDDIANDVYFLRRARDAARRRRLSAGAIGDWIVRWTTGYGVRPWRMVGTALILVAIGTVGFHLPGTARSKPEPPGAAAAARPAKAATTANADESYCKHPEVPDWQSSFWLAIQTISPVEIPPESRWRAVACPMPLTGWQNYYFAALLRAVGVLFVGLVAASVTGLLRFAGSRE